MAEPFQVNLHLKDVGKTFEYFTEVLGFTPEFRVRGDAGKTVFAGVLWGPRGQGGRVILGDIHEALHGHYDHGDFGKQMEEHPLGTGVVLYFHTRGVDKLHERIVARGAMIDEPPTDQFWGERTISVLTPEGYYVSFAEPIRGFKFPPGFEARLEQFAPQPGARRKIRGARRAKRRR
ncbi:MAG TPA: VOC family protein [Candidatus Thermoplasmatota archaeon]|nr:VOC family protein [Candidatus Thermoplasmatota archaeon]